MVFNMVYKLICVYIYMYIYKFCHLLLIFLWQILSRCETPYVISYINIILYTIFYTMRHYAVPSLRPYAMTSLRQYAMTSVRHDVNTPSRQWPLMIQ